MPRLLTFLTIFSLTFSAAAEERDGTITAGKLRMRAKPGTRFEFVGFLKRDEKVRIVSEKDGWVELLAPAGVSGWVSNKFISSGKITGDGVKLRAGAGIVYSAFAELQNGTDVKIIENRDPWVRIQAPKGTTVWTSAQYVKLAPVKKIDKPPVVKLQDKSAEELAKLRQELEERIARTRDLESQLDNKVDELKKLKLKEESLQSLKGEIDLARTARLKNEKILEKLQEITSSREEETLPQANLIISKDGKLTLDDQTIDLAGLDKKIRELNLKNDNRLLVNIRDHHQDAEAKLQLRALSTLNQAGITRFRLYSGDKLIADKGRFISDLTKVEKDPFKEERQAEKRLSINLDATGKMFIAKAQVNKDQLGQLLEKLKNHAGSEAVVLLKAHNKCPYAVVRDTVDSINNAGLEKVKVVIEEDVTLEIAGPVEETPKAKPLPPGRSRFTGYILNVRDEDRSLVDFALAVKINGSYYPIAYLKGDFDSLKKHYLKEVEIIGIEKRLENWTRPILYVEEINKVQK